MQNEGCDDRAFLCEQPGQVPQSDRDRQGVSRWKRVSVVEGTVSTLPSSCVLDGDGGGGQEGDDQESKAMLESLARARFQFQTGRRGQVQAELHGTAATPNYASSPKLRGKRKARRGADWLSFGSSPTQAAAASAASAAAAATAWTFKLHSQSRSHRTAAPCITSLTVMTMLVRNASESLSPTLYNHTLLTCTCCTSGGSVPRHCQQVSHSLVSGPYRRTGRRL